MHSLVPGGLLAGDCWQDWNKAPESALCIIFDWQGDPPLEHISDAKMLCTLPSKLQRIFMYVEDPSAGWQPIAANA